MMANSSFNPYRQWLGIGEHELPANLYRLFGLSLYESDPTVIAQAADRTIAYLRSVPPGEHVAHWQRLLQELERAKQYLTHPEHKARYDAHLRSKGAGVAARPAARAAAAAAPASQGAPAAQPAWPQAGPPVARPVGAPVPVAQPAAVAMPVGAPNGQSAVPDFGVPSTSASSKLAQRRRKNSPLPMVVAMLMAVGGLAGVMYYIFQERSPLAGPPAQSVVAQNSPAPAAQPQAGEPQRPAQQPRDTQRDPNAPIPVPGLNYGEDAEQFTPDFTIDQGAGNMGMNPGLGTSAGMDAEANSNPMPAPGSNTPPASSASPAIDEPPATDEPEMEMANLPAASMPAEPKSSAAPTPEQTAAFDKAIRASFEALGNRDLEGASQQLAVARENAVSAEQKSQLRGMETVQQGVEAFWDAARDGLKGLVGTSDELELKTGRVGIVEAAPDFLVLRIAGQNRRFEFDTMPSGLAMILAKRWFNMDAASTKIFIGSFMLVDPAGDKAEVRRLWEEAASGGVKIDDLLPLLDLKE